MEVVSGVRHAADVLGLFTRAQPEWGAAHVARALQISRSHAHRLLSTLAEVGLLDKVQPAGRFRLSWTWFAFADVLLASDPLVCAAVPILRKLEETHYVECVLGVWAQGSILSLRPSTVPMISPLDFAEGFLPALVVIAELTDEELDRMLLSRGTVAGALPRGPRLANCIHKVRTLGLLTKTDAEAPDSYWEAAAAVVDDQGRVVAAVAARTAVTRSLEPRRAAAAAKRAADLLSASLLRSGNALPT
jgi:DNA-binding IclR family transcriptional regulator